MRKLRIAVVDLVTKRPTKRLYARVMNANFASIMPQVVAGWCEEEGHDVTFVCYTGREDLAEELPNECDLVFIGAFTQAAQLAYCLSALCRSRGAITVLGGPHARCYPEDAQKYFDYVLGFTNRETIRDVAPGLRTAPSDGRVPQRRGTANASSGRPRTLEVHRADAHQGAHHQDSSDDGELGLPVYLQLLHRLHRPVSAPRLRRDEGAISASC